MFLAVLALRVALFVSRGLALDHFWDPLAGGASLYALAFLALSIYRPYLLAPVDLIALLYLARLLRKWAFRGSGLRTLAAVAAVALLAIQSASGTLARLIDRKARIVAKSALADFLASQPGSSSGAIDLYFPHSGGFEILELAAYLRHRGQRVELITEDLQPGTPPLVRLHAPQRFESGRCQYWRRLRCYEAPAPPQGAWTVLLPDDGITPAAGRAAYVGRETLMSFHAPSVVLRIETLLVRMTALTPAMSRRNGAPAHALHLAIFGPDPGTIRSDGAKQSAPSR